MRVPINGNQFTDEFKAKSTFDAESHLKKKGLEEECLETSSTCSNDSLEDECSETLSTCSKDCMKTGSGESMARSNAEMEVDPSFTRKFRNIDLSSCWLNACLQLLLAALDHLPSLEFLNSELGAELRKLQINQDNVTLDSTNVKHILVAAEDVRIATRISEVVAEENDPAELERRRKAILKVRLDLVQGQQCVRDFFLCLEENVENWPDVFSCFGFRLTHSTTCCSCNQTQSFETTQMHIELDVPPDSCELSQSIDDYLNTSSLVGLRCESKCQRIVQKEKTAILTSNEETNFLLVILSRAVETVNGYQFNRNRTISTNDVFIRY